MHRIKSYITGKLLKERVFERLEKLGWTDIELHGLFDQPVRKEDIPDNALIRWPELDG